MPYIGRELDRGNYLKLDDISSSFNNSLTTFNLTNGGKAFYPGSAFSILVVLAGVVQEPETAYQINQAQITFASAPLAGDQFFCIVLGQALGVNTPANGSVNGTQLAKPFNYDGYFYLDDTNNRVGIATATPQKPLHVVGEGQFDSVRVLGDLTVDGTTTTLDTVVTEVDKLEVLANNSTVAVAVTQSGSGDAAIFMGGNFGIGTNNPAYALDVKQTDTTNPLTIAAKGGTDGGGYFWESNSGTTYGAVGYGKLITANSGSTNSAITTWGSQDLLLGTNRVERLRITSTGRQQGHTDYAAVGINTFASWARTGGAIRAEVGYNAETTDYMYFGTGTNHPVALRVNNDTALYIKNDTGRSVGIGSDNPQSQFEVFGTSPIIRSKHSTSQAYTQINHDGTVGYLDWSSGSLLFRGASNTERLRITSGGALSFTGPGSIQNEAADTVTMLSGGTASNSGANIVLYGQSHASDANVIRLRTSATDRLRIDSSGRVLMADATTAGPMETFGSAVLQVATTAGGTLVLGRNDTSVASGSGIGNIYFNANDSTGNAWNEIARISVDADGDHANNDYPSRMEFYTTGDGEATPTERLRITSGGNIGIGTDDPDTQIHIEAAEPFVRLENTHAGSKRLD